MDSLKTCPKQPWFLYYKTRSCQNGFEGCQDSLTMLGSPFRLIFGGRPRGCHDPCLSGVADRIRKHPQALAGQDEPRTSSRALSVELSSAKECHVECTTVGLSIGVRSRGEPSKSFLSTKGIFSMQTADGRFLSPDGNDLIGGPENFSLSQRKNRHPVNLKNFLQFTSHPVHLRPEGMQLLENGCARMLALLML